MFWWPLANTLLILLLALYWIIFTDKQIAIKHGKQFIIGFAIIYTTILVGGLYSENKAEALFKIQQKTPLLFLPVIFGTTRLVNGKLLSGTILTFSFSAALMCIYFLSVQALNILLDKPATFHGYDLIVFPQMTPSAFTTLALFALTSFLYLCFYQSNNFSLSKKYLFAGSAFLIFITLFLAGNRLSIILACTFLLILILRKVNNRILFVPLITLSLLLLVFNNSYLTDKFKKLWIFSNESVIQLDADRSLGRSWDGSSIRLAIWRCSFDLIRQHTLIGLGTGDAQDELQKTYEKRKFYFASRYNNYNAHNQYIQQLLSHGILGLGTLMLSIGIGFYIAFKQKNTLYFYFLVIFVVICLTESFLEINKGIVWYSFFNSLFAFSKNNNI